MIVRRIPVLFVILGASLASTSVHGQTEPSRMGLQLWLDASDDASFDGDTVHAWRDKSGEERHAVALADAPPPQRVESTLNGRPVVRFPGKSSFRVPTIRKTSGPIAVFVVASRPKEAASEAAWQRVVSGSDGDSPDTASPGFSQIANIGKNKASGEPFAPIVYEKFETGAVLDHLVIGANFQGNRQFFHGDIAEVLIYDRPFVAEDEIQSVLQYLANKWDATIAREEEGWTRVGPLVDVPKRINDTYPLSDQNNENHWQVYEPLTDEFEGVRLDTDKWMPKHLSWLGRQPAFFWTENVQVDSGTLQLTMRKEESPDMPKDKGYHTYTSACMHATEKVLYGYFEVKARPMNSGGSSSFWFSGRDGEWRTEIDVYEIGGKAPGFERKYNMNAHVFQTPEETRHWNIGGKWEAPWNLADDFHVYGIDWNRDELVYYVDGVVVRRMNNTHWHRPIYMIFDSETMPTWMGMPEDEDLPSTYHVEYVRAWKRK